MRMSTHNICFYEEVLQIILQLLSNTLLIRPSDCSLHFFIIITITLYNNQLIKLLLLLQFNPLPQSPVVSATDSSKNYSYFD